MSFIRYSSYKPSGVQWLGDVPEHWEVQRVKHALLLLTAKAETRGFAVSLENVESWTGRYCESDSEYQGDGVAFGPGDVLFGKLRPYLAKVYLAEREGEAVGEFYVMRPLSYAVDRFAQYHFLNRSFIDVVDGSTFGSKMPRVSWEVLGNMALPLPPLPEQHAIAAFLDRETAKIDELVAEQRRLIELLKEKRQAVISHAVTKGLDPNAPMKDSGVEWIGEVPEGWEVGLLKRVFRSVDYGISSSLDPDGAVAVLRMGNISEGTIVTEDLKYTNAVDPNLLLVPGDLLYNRTNSLDLIGKVGLFSSHGDDPASFASYLVRLRLVESCIPDYFAYMLNTDEILGIVRANAFVAIGQCNLNPTRYGHIVVAIPTLHEQSRIVDFLNHHKSKTDNLISDAEQAISLLLERRTALISAAVTGQIDVRQLEAM